MLRHFVDLPPGRSASKSARIIFLSGLIAAVAVLRFVPHPPNFAPIGAMALFGGACFADRRVALLLPLAILFLSDLFLGLHVLVPVVYGSFAANVLLGRWLRGRRRLVPVALATLAGSIQFFVVTNFACWLLWYPHTAAGLASCYIAALPFFHNTLLGDATFVGVLFGAMALAEAGFPVIREHPLPVAA